jgi:hypothetical protein
MFYQKPDGAALQLRCCLFPCKMTGWRALDCCSGVELVVLLRFRWLSPFSFLGIGGMARRIHDDAVTQQLGSRSRSTLSWYPRAINCLKTDNYLRSRNHVNSMHTIKFYL